MLFAICSNLGQSKILSSGWPQKCWTTVAQTMEQEVPGSVLKLGEWKKKLL